MNSHGMLDNGQPSSPNDTQGYIYPGSYTNMMMGHLSGNQSGAPGSMLAAQLALNMNTSMVSPNTMTEEPMYVNAKQYNRILKRREARARWEAAHKSSRKEKGYIHESRHRHAMRRPRGPGGRFLSAAELAALEQEGQLKTPTHAPSNLTIIPPNPSTETAKSKKNAIPTPVTAMAGNLKGLELKN